MSKSRRARSLGGETPSRSSWIRRSLLVAALACSPAVGQRGSDVAEPEALRTAGADYPEGAHRQSAEDTLAGSATPERPAPGWKVENGKLVPDPESRHGGHRSHEPAKPKCPKREEGQPSYVQSKACIAAESEAEESAPEP